MALIPGTPCWRCYASKGFYTMPAVRASQLARYRYVRHMLVADPAGLEAELVAAIAPHRWFRWHDSGDLFSRPYAELVARVCRATPGTRHWIPTQERALAQSIDWPANVTVRYSRSKVNGNTRQADVESVVATKDTALPTGATPCRAPAQAGECRDCRACWDASVALVAYQAH